ncbi:uncharacterized protein LOC119006284 [Acanthopagrus latus]|uniref:uncharacterized protein LOC119006284 n=1 Tax=Acanthopagrus latus TaxID=8177 RepID=UPI00187CF6AA|nr:uncharacterized protein LOC119006284 [Acanthopagrus latus]
MHNSDPLSLSPLRADNSQLTTVKERSTLSQVIRCKAASMERILQLVHRVAQKSCIRACELFCCPIDTVLYEKVTCCSARTQQTMDAKTAQALAIRSPPSTILIVNICNSTLIDCVIGNDTYPSVMAESQPLMTEPQFHMHDLARCSYSCGQQGPAQTTPAPLPSAEPPHINIHSSRLNCVIFGDNNYMHADQSHSTEAEEV